MPHIYPAPRFLPSTFQMFKCKQSFSSASLPYSSLDNFSASASTLRTSHTGRCVFWPPIIVDIADVSNIYSTSSTPPAIKSKQMLLLYLHTLKNHAVSNCHYKRFYLLSGGSQTRSVVLIVM